MPILIQNWCRVGGTGLNAGTLAERIYMLGPTAQFAQMARSKSRFIFLSSECRSLWFHQTCRPLVMAGESLRSCAFTISASLAGRFLAKYLFRTARSSRLSRNIGTIWRT